MRRGHRVDRQRLAGRSAGGLGRGPRGRLIRRAGWRSPAAVGALDGGAAALLYSIGWARAFSFDASRTVGQFVATPSLADAFRQDRFNNHPLFSALDHLVYRATGSQDERVLRVLPIALGALAVALVAAAVARRFGPLAGHVAGATLAVNAMAVRQFREVRGYALVTLAAVVATLLLFRMLRDHRPRPWLLLAYALALAAAVCTHLFAAALLPVHALVAVGARRSPVRLVVPWAAAVAVGVAIQWPAIVDGLSRPPRYVFAPTFPLRLGANLLGGPALAGMAVLVVVGWTVLRDRRWLPWVVIGTTAMVVGAWLAGPSWLDSRFFIWLAPATSVAAGAAVSRHPRLALLAGACVVAQLAILGPPLARDEVPNRIAAGYVRAGQRDGRQVCALGRTRAGLLAYVDDVRVIRTVPELPTCEMAVEAAGPTKEPLMGPACDRFAYVLALPARHRGAVFADQPLAPVAEHEAEAWRTTAEAPVCQALRP
ncbi:MAG: glycosyltransferase family 39 protein [Acidimicrobiales bacterium]